MPGRWYNLYSTGLVDNHVFLSKMLFNFFFFFCFVMVGISLD